MLEREFNYFLDNQNELVKKHRGKYVVIVADKVVGEFESDAAAYFETIKKYQLGTFLIQLCEPGDGAYTQIINHPGVVI